MGDPALSWAPSQMLGSNLESNTVEQATAVSKKFTATITVKSVAICGTSGSSPTRLELLSIEELNIAVHALSRAN
jgi:hypothetical protein